MPFVPPKSYLPNPLLRNGHVHTIYPALFRRVQKRYNRRERIVLSDGDFLDVDLLISGNPRVVLLIHGLEGSSESKYMLGATKFYSDRGYDIAALNLRSCSGEMNLAQRLYHHGVTDDVHEALEWLAPSYKKVYLMGFSLGGNLVLKYLADQNFTIPGNVRSGVAVSAPVDLPSCVKEVHKRSRKLYHDRFLRDLKEKIRQKALQQPTPNAQLVDRIRTLKEFDDFFTAPIHGFRDANDYHQKASSLQDLPNLRRPALLLNALDDPILGHGCFPQKEVEKTRDLYAIYPKFGGHVGFCDDPKKGYFSERMGLEFFQENS
ncbi:MAG: alpha/beta fold hydrolase [Bacteroidota bacterium]|nr:alpha/beta fold hydrolase [Bacteroidota bacterium]